MEENLTDVAGTLSIHENGGQFGVYEEWRPGDQTRHEFPTIEEAERAVIERDKARAYYFKRFFGADDPDNPQFYHFVINTSDVPVDYAVDLVVQSAKALEEGRLRTVDTVG